MGGLALRVPDGLSLRALGLKSGVLRRDLRWEEISHWEVVQTKRFGALSANAGNLYADLNFKTVHGESHSISLDHFREPARIIWNRLQDAMETAPALLDQASPPNRAEATATADDKLQAISTALAKMLWHKGGAVVLVDAETGKFVQFTLVDDSLLIDLPEQTLDANQLPRATEFFARYGEEIRESDLLDRAGGVAVDVRRSFQLDFGDDVERATRVALDLFTEVFQLKPDFELMVELV
jgi:hypothetical protein